MPSDERPEAGKPPEKARLEQLTKEALAAAIQDAMRAKPSLPYEPGQLFITEQTAQLWQGQFPPPEAIERYEAVLPGCFDRLIGMAETQIEIQAKETENAQTFARNDTRRGHWLGFAAMVLAMGGALICVRLGAFVIAGGFLTVPVMGVAKALVDSVSGAKRDGS